MTVRATATAVSSRVGLTKALASIVVGENWVGVAVWVPPCES